MRITLFQFTAALAVSAGAISACSARLDESSLDERLQAAVFNAGQMEGIFDGLVLDGHNGTLTLNIGFGEIDGVPFQLKTAETFASLGTIPLSPPGALAPNKAVYCYVIGQGSDPNFVPAAFSVVCSTSIGPAGDGHPSNGLMAPDGGVNTTSALFVGSFITYLPRLADGGFTGSSVKMVPFQRVGEEVRLAPLALSTPLPGLCSPSVYDPGLVAKSNTFAGAGAAPELATFNFTGDYPVLSASAGIFDVQYCNPDPDLTGQFLYFLDPNAHAVTSDNDGGYFKAVQAQMEIDSANPAYSTVSVQSLRLRLNLDTSSNLYTAMDQSPLHLHEDLQVVTVLRGYVEPVSQLLSR